MSKRAEFRRKAGLTQLELAQLTGIHAPQICRWERGQIELREDEVERIATVLRERIACWLKSIIAGEQQHAISQ